MFEYMDIAVLRDTANKQELRIQALEEKLSDMDKYLEGWMEAYLAGK